MKTILSDGKSSLSIIEDFVSQDFFDFLTHAIPWQQNQIKIFGRMVSEPRLTAWFGPPYTYSGLKWPGQAMPDFLLDLMQKTQNTAGFEFNSCLLNYYRNGQDSMGWHRDNEPEMDTACIASISLGATRDLRIRKGKNGPSCSLPLPGGSLLLMHHFQESYYHAIPKRKNMNVGRINLTFRHIFDK